MSDTAFAWTCLLVAGFTLVGLVALGAKRRRPESEWTPWHQEQPPIAEETPDEQPPILAVPPATFHDVEIRQPDEFVTDCPIGCGGCSCHRGFAPCGHCTDHVRYPDDVDDGLVPVEVWPPVDGSGFGMARVPRQQRRRGVRP